MIRNVGTLIILLGMTQVSFANAVEENALTHVDLERVGRIALLNGVESWSRVDDDTIIIWTSAFRPYLVDLSRKVLELKFTQSIAVTSSAGQILEKFDNVIVDGIRYPIAAIYKLDRESAKNIQTKADRE